MSEQNAESFLEHTDDGDLVIHREQVLVDQPVVDVVEPEVQRQEVDADSRVFQRRSLIAGQVNEGPEVSQVNARFGLDGDTYTAETEAAVKNWQSENGFSPTGALTSAQYGQL